MKKTYRQLNKELDEIVYQLDSEMDDIDKAVDLYNKAEKIIGQIDDYLKHSKIKIDKIKNKSQK